MQLDTKKITPGWIKLIGGAIVASVLAYQAIGVSTETNEKQDRQLVWLQGSAKAQSTDIALIKQRQEQADKQYIAMGEKLEKDRIRNEAIYEKVNDTLSQLQVSIAKLNTTMESIQRENEKGR